MADDKWVRELEVIEVLIQRGVEAVNEIRQAMDSKPALLTFKPNKTFLQPQSAVLLEDRL